MKNNRENPLGCKLSWALISADMLKNLLDNSFLTVPSAVYLYLRLNYDIESGRSYTINYKDIAGCLGFHEASVYRAAKSLEDAGLITRNKRGDLTAHTFD